MHVKSGLFIEQYPDGAVEIEDTTDGRNGAYLLSNSEWVSAIAEVANGYSDPAEAVRFAQAFHDGSVRRLLYALELILAEPHGCPFCDSGKLRKPIDPTKGHTDDCGFDAARQAIAKLSSSDYPATLTQAIEQMNSLPDISTDDSLRMRRR
jgi:hypothetical protein